MLRDVEDEELLFLMQVWVTLEINNENQVGVGQNR